MSRRRFAARPNYVSIVNFFGTAKNTRMRSCPDRPHHRGRGNPVVTVQGGRHRHPWRLEHLGRVRYESCYHQDAEPAYGTAHRIWETSDTPLPELEML